MELKFCKVCHKGHVNHSTVIDMLFYFIALPGCRHVTSKFEYNFKNPKSKYSLPVSILKPFDYPSIKGGLFNVIVGTLTLRKDKSDKIIFIAVLYSM